jgi:pimeloyl-ACP methyl ester carboxylesterase
MLRSMVTDRLETEDGLLLTEHEFELPLDHDDPGGERIGVFAREVALPDAGELPVLVYFQGGPGAESPRPATRSAVSWLPFALRFFRVLLLDQRGTGRSSPVPDPAGSIDAAADRLACFRADSIVRDAEAIREELGIDRWSALGQSFGGFCVLRYLSSAPEGLAEAFITGGVPALGDRIDDAYRLTYERTRERNERYYARFPEDRERVRRIHEQIAEGSVRLPSGDILSVRRFRQLGTVLGASDGAERLHFLIELPAGSRAFAHDLAEVQRFERNPLYAVVHEASWADGGTTRWSAERMLPDDFREQTELFTGEHVYPWMFEDYGSLTPFGEVAEPLAARTWPRLYDPERLAENEVPVAAAVYEDDLYVPRELSVETARAVRGLRLWTTAEYQHNGLRVAGERILERLIELARSPG